MDPTVAQLLRQRAAAGFPTPPRRRQGLPAPIRELHRRVLAHFAATGQPPPSTILTAWAIELGVELRDAPGRLVDADLVEADIATGHLTGAYPFVASPRGHQVRLPGALTVEAHFAIDALGIPAMLDQESTIGSHDPLTGGPISVEVHDGHARWKSAHVMVGYTTQPHGPTGHAGTVGQAACCRCPLINFHVSAEPALGWQQREGVRLELLAIPRRCISRRQCSGESCACQTRTTRTQPALRPGRPDDRGTGRPTDTLTPKGARHADQYRPRAAPRAVDT